MTDSELVDAISDAEATALRRLGSDKYLIAATGADLSAPTVLRSVATTAASGRDTFAAWADGTEEPAKTTFANAAETEADAFERVAAELAAEDADPPAVDPGDAVHRALQSADGAVEQAGALVGRGLVLDRARLQVVNFFVNEGETGRADLARALRDGANDQVEAGAALLGSVSEAGHDRDRARGTARAVISAAYDEYAATLEEMGVDPKPVC